MSTEFELIKQLAGRFDAPDGVRVGIGDDAAVVQPDQFELVAMDTLVEDVHFRRDWSCPADVGWKLAAANFSDIAAMGGEPGAFFLSLAMPTPVDEEWVDQFCEGIEQAVDEMSLSFRKVSAAGGDLSSTAGPIVATMTLLGRLAPAGEVLRDGACPGDAIVVSAVPGAAAAGLAALKRGEETSAQFAGLVNAHRRPRAELRLGRRLALEAIPGAMIDVSDGLIQDLYHILDASGVGAHIDLSQLEIPEEMSVAQQEGLGTTGDWITGGGEDFCLLMTVAPQRLERLNELCAEMNRQVYRIGTIRGADAGVEIVDLDGESYRGDFPGYTHFEEP